MTASRSGPSQVLVLRGQAGVGKTALLRYVLGKASGQQIAQASGIQSEMELAFAGLQQFCAPLTKYSGAIPDPQREALAIAFGTRSGTPPDRFLIGLAVLSLLAAAAEHQPVLCVIDDAQWLDRVSLQTLAFVTRRLGSEPVAMLFAVRDGIDSELAGLPELTVRGLRPADAGTLLDSVIPGLLDERVRDRIVAETQGNPLALLELPRDMTAEELAGGFGWPDGGRLAGQIEQTFLRRVHQLPAHTQTLLLAAATDPLGDVTLLARAAQQLGIPMHAIAPAEAADLVELSTRGASAIRWCVRLSISVQIPWNAEESMVSWPAPRTRAPIPIVGRGTARTRPRVPMRPSRRSWSSPPAALRPRAAS
ncbi:Putative transcriptional regulator%2C LuxR family [Mycobacteroides abscessus]|nr:Putative transcriptional regulator%2C LuxR family [Mycobacteroides abscessus]